MEKKAYDLAAWIGFIGFCALGVAAAFACATLPGADADATKRGTASYYSTKECTTRANPRCLTASGEPLNDGAMTAAMWGVPLGTRVRITHGNKSIVVRINDRGPAKRLVAEGRCIDLTKAAFGALAPLSRGLIPVTVEVQP